MQVWKIASLLSKKKKRKKERRNEIRRWMIIRKVAMENERDKGCSLNTEKIYIYKSKFVVIQFI